MFFMNTYDIAEAKHLYHPERTPELARAVHFLAKLEEWTNSHSDGWAYWPKPVRAAKALMTLIQSVDPCNPVDVTDVAVRKACQPIRAFLTRQGVNHEVVF